MLELKATVEAQFKVNYLYYKNFLSIHTQDIKENARDGKPDYVL